MNKLKYKGPNVKKLPKCSPSERQRIAEFLEFMRDRTELNLNNHRVFGMTDKSARTQGMIRHLKDRLATITFLQSVNDQRTVLDNEHGS